MKKQMSYYEEVVRLPDGNIQGVDGLGYPQKDGTYEIIKSTCRWWINVNAIKEALINIELEKNNSSSDEGGRHATSNG